MSLSGRASVERVGRLFAHDFSILLTSARASFGWRDRIALMLAFALLIAGLRSVITDQPGDLVRASAFGVGIVAGFAVGRSILARLSYHASDGMLAADALVSVSRWRYASLFHGLAVVGLSVSVALVGGGLTLPFLTGYLCGLALGHGLPRLRVQRVSAIARFMHRGRTTLAWTRESLAGIVAALLVAALLLPLAGMEGSASLLATASATGIVMLILTTVDHGSVRFMAMSGYGVWGALRVHLLPGFWFLVLAVVFGVVIHGPTNGTVIAGIAIAALGVQALRVLAYRIHTKRFGDWLVAILIGTVALVAWSLPFVVPLVLIVMFWHLHRRASASTWSIQ